MQKLVDQWWLPVTHCSSNQKRAKLAEMSSLFLKQTEKQTCWYLLNPVLKPCRRVALCPPKSSFPRCQILHHIDKRIDLQSAAQFVEGVRVVEHLHASQQKQ
jgi:hypothetical protein